MFEFITENLLVLGVIAGVLQVIGYWLYITDDHIEPNPVTWFMFAYGTALLTLLEWDTDATIPELILPAVCSVLAVYVSYQCWKKARLITPSMWWPRDWWPDDIVERWSFISDIIITVAYVFAWWLAAYAFISTEHKELAVFLFLFLSNLSTFPSFYPIIKSTYLAPEKEAALPWFTWAAAYALLGVITYATQGNFWNILMFYPVSNAVLHGVVGILAAKR
jgi:hypothetical protein